MTLQSSPTTLMPTWKYHLLVLTPDPIRGEAINVGVAVIDGDKVVFRFDHNLEERLAALGAPSLSFRARKSLDFLLEYVKEDLGKFNEMLASPGAKLPDYLRFRPERSWRSKSARDAVYSLYSRYIDKRGMRIPS